MVIELLQHRTISGCEIVHPAQQLSLHREAVGNDMRVADDAVFIVLAAIDHAQQDQVSKKCRNLSRKNVRPGGKGARAADAAPIIYALARFRALDFLEPDCSPRMLLR